MRCASIAIVALLCTVAFGLAEGWWTNRWHSSGEIDQAAARCKEVPLTIAYWDGVDQELDDRQLKLAKINGYILRKYVHRQTGDVITVMLVCGRPGPIGVHTPDVCFQSNGMEMKGAPEQIHFDLEAPRSASNFWGARFEEPGPIHTGTAVLWSWTADGQWSAPDSPRIQFARAAALYKLYVIHPTNQLDQKPGSDADVDKFLRVFLPACKALFPSGKD